MQSASLLFEFFRCVLYSVLGMAGVSCYILADTFFIAQGLGQTGLAALNLAIPMFNLISGIGLMLGMGGATIFTFLSEESPALPSDTSGNPEGSRIFTMTASAGLLCGLLMTVSGLFFAEPLAVLFGASGDTLPMTAVYLQFLLLFSPAFLLNNILLCFIRNDHAPGLAMTAMLAGSFSNILLDLLLIFGCRLGMLGAVSATCLAPVISMLCMLPHFLKKKNTFHLIPFSPRCPGLFRVLSLGFPSLLAQVSGAVVMILCNYLILAEAQDLGVAAYGVTANLALVVNAGFTGIAQGAQPLFSEAFGSQNRRNIRRLLRFSLVSAAVSAAALYVLIAVFADPITSVFNRTHDPAMQTLSAKGLRLFFLSNLFLALNLIFTSYFPSVNEPRPAQILSCLRSFALIIPASLLLAKGFGMTGIFLACPVTEAVTACIGCGFLLVSLKKQKP